MNSWGLLLSNKELAIGEVAGIEAGKIEVFIYPENFDQVRVGSILIINSSATKPIGIVFKLAHTSRYGTFTPMKMTRSEIESAYPDLKHYHLFVSTMIYTSHLDPHGEVRHSRSSAPRLHDLVYIVNSKELLDDFFRPSGEWNFDFLRYFFAEGANVLDFRDFLFCHRDYFKKHEEEKESILESLIRSLSRINTLDIGALLEEITDVLMW